MKNIKEQVYKALCAVTENVSDSYPRTWAEDSTIKFRYGNSVKLGFVAFQDAGEPFFGGRNIWLLRRQLSMFFRLPQRRSNCCLPWTTADWE